MSELVPVEPPSENQRHIVPVAAIGNEKSRLMLFARWLDNEGAHWFAPRLRDYRDYLLNVRGLSPVSTAAHLSAVRSRYRDLVSERDLLYTLVPSELSFQERKAYVDEIEIRIRNQISPGYVKVPVTTVQDESDLLHIRLSPAQVNELIHAPGTSDLFGIRNTAIITLMLCTGIREGELTALEVDDLEHRLNGELALRVRRGKGNKTRLVPYGDLNWSLNIVYGWLSAAGITSDWVFRKIQRGGKHVSPRPLTTRAIQKILAQYQVWNEQRLVAVRPHDLRRTYARNLYDAGVDPVRIKQNLAHSHLQTTLGYIGDIDAVKRRPPAMYEVPKDILSKLAR